MSLNIKKNSNRFCSVFKKYGFNKKKVSVSQIKIVYLKTQNFIYRSQLIAIFSNLR